MFNLHHLGYFWKLGPLHKWINTATFRYAHSKICTCCHLSISYKLHILKSKQDEWQKYHTCETCSISSTFLLIPSKAAARTSSREMNPENLMNPISHSGETHLAISLGIKPSWTQSRARNEANIIIYADNSMKIRTRITCRYWEERWGYKSLY